MTIAVVEAITCTEEAGAEGAEAGAEGAEAEDEPGAGAEQPAAASTPKTRPKTRPPAVVLPTMSRC